MELRKEIIKAGFRSQAQFAKYNGISANAVSKWVKTGKVPQWALNQLSERQGIQSKEAEIKDAVYDKIMSLIKDAKSKE